MLSITPVMGDVSSADIKKTLGLTDITISDSEFKNILNSRVSDDDDSTLLDSARAITIEKNYVESLQKLDLQNTIRLLDATADVVDSIDNVAQLGTTEWLGLGGDILRYSIGVPVIAISWRNIRLNEMIYGSIPTPGYVPLVEEAGWSDDDAWNEVYSHFKGDIDIYFKTDQEKKFLHELFRHALILKQNPNYLTEINKKAKMLAGIIRERMPERKPSFWTNIFNRITEGIGAVKEFFSIPEAHSAPPTPIPFTPIHTPTHKLFTTTPTLTYKLFTPTPAPTHKPTHTSPQDPYAGIRAVFGQQWTPAQIFVTRGLVNQGIYGAVNINGGIEVYTIGPSGTKETSESYYKKFGIYSQNGIVGTVSIDQARLLGINVLTPSPTPTPFTPILTPTPTSTHSPTPTPFTPTSTSSPDPYAGIRAVFGPQWTPAQIFVTRGLVNQGVYGAVNINGGIDVYTIGPGGTKETPESYFQKFGTYSQNGIVGTVTIDQARQLGINV